jgi:hypothetical protein
MGRWAQGFEVIGRAIFGILGGTHSKPLCTVLLSNQL